METLEVLGKKVFKLPYVVKDKQKIVNAIDTALGVLTYRKPEPRTVIIPGNIADLPDELPGGLFKVTNTHNGVLYSSEGGPGIQLQSSIFMDDSSTGLFKGIFETIVNMHNEVSGEDLLPKYQQSWFFMSPPSNQAANFHEHTRFSPDFQHDKPTYTWTYYLQVPDNCEGDEGKLAFTDNSFSFGTGMPPEEAIDVQLDTIYIFPSEMLHRPNLAPNSSKGRYTAAGNIVIPASEKSLFID